jgi:hypothetical protein
MNQGHRKIGHERSVTGGYDSPVPAGAARTKTTSGRGTLNRAGAPWPGSKIAEL